VAAAQRGRPGQQRGEDVERDAPAPHH